MGFSMTVVDGGRFQHAGNARAATHLIFSAIDFACRKRRR
jgi:hypothetical protein